MSTAVLSRAALVVGLGRSGSAAARMLTGRGVPVAVTDDDKHNLERFEGVADKFDQQEALGRLASFDLVVVSPGVARWHPLLAAAEAARITVVSELALAASLADAPIIAVTGTNGKSTTVSLLAGILEAAGLRAPSAGNIGQPLSTVVEREADYLVVEVSSFQLEWPGAFSPHVACLLNLGADHRDLHHDLATYRGTKLRLFGGPVPPRFAVIGAGAGHETVVAAEGSGAQLWRFGRGGLGSGPAAVKADLAGRRLVSGDGRVMELAAAWPRAVHDFDNAAAAAAIALALGVAGEAVSAGCRRFSPLAHRLALVASAGGLAFWDDSKATNPDATLASLETFDGRVVLLVGGDDKGADLSPLASAAAKIRGAVAFGAARERVGAVLEGSFDCPRAKTLEEAFDRAVKIAEVGDAVLLAPACSSLDEFSDYAERGRRFAELASRWAESGR